MTTQEAPQGEPSSFERTILAQRLNGIFRTGGGVAAGGRREGGNEFPIEPNGEDEQFGQEAKNPVHGVAGMGCGEQ